LHDGAIPAISTNPDTYHAGDSWLSTATEFWTKQAQDASGGFFQGLGKGLAGGFGISEQTVWLIAGGFLLYLVLQKKGRR